MEKRISVLLFAMVFAFAFSFTFVSCKKGEEPSSPTALEEKKEEAKEAVKGIAKDAAVKGKEAAKKLVK